MHGRFVDILRFNVHFMQIRLHFLENFWGGISLLDMKAIDNKVIEMVDKMRECGAVVNYNITYYCCYRYCYS